MKYIDRVNEINTIKEIYNKSNNSTLLILYSKTGVGKSTLSKRFAENFVPNDDISVLNIYTNRINKSETTVHEAYLIEIFKAFFNHFNNDKELSFESYICNGHNKQYRKFIFEKVMENIQKESKIKNAFLKSFVMLFFNRLLKLNYFNIERILNDYSAQLIQIINNYIEYILTKKKIILTLDNLQNADYKSIDNIKDIIVKTKTYKHFFIFEYTIENDDERISILKLRDDLENLDVDVKIMELAAMDNNSAVEAAMQKSDNPSDISVPQDIMDVYARSEGNIRYLEDFLRHYNTNHKYEILYTPTIDSIMNLKKNELFVFCIICINDARINKFELQEIVKNNYINLSETLDILEKEYDLIERVDNTISIKHASIFDSWKHINNTNNKIKLININAFNAVAQYYNNLLNNSELVSTQKAFIFLLKLYSKYDKEKIYSLLNQFDYLAVEFIIPDQLKEYIKTVDMELEENIDKFVDFYYKLINICLDVKLYADANRLLDKVQAYSTAYKYIFYKCNVYIQSEEYNKNIDFINEIVHKIEDTYFILYLKLFLIVSYRSINNYDAAKKIDAEIKQIIDKYKTSIFYAFYLRLSYLIKPRDTTIDDVIKSIKIFEERKLKTQAAKSQVTLSFLYAITGNSNKAIEQSNKAEKIIMKNSVNRHIFLNNRSAILMLYGKITHEIINMLDTAYLTAITTFDKLVILNNKLAYYLENNDLENAKAEAYKSILILDHENDKQLKAIVYYNIYLYYSYIEDYANGEKYFTKCYEIKEHCESIFARLTNRKTNDGTDILISHKWHIALLDFWSIDYVENFS